MLVASRHHIITESLVYMFKACYSKTAINHTPGANIEYTGAPGGPGG